MVRRRATMRAVLGRVVAFALAFGVLTAAGAAEISYAGGVDTAASSVASAGSISGTVTSSDGSPLSGITVAATFQEGWDPWLRTVTDEAGEYTLVGLREGTYVITFFAEGTDFLREHWDDAATRADATPVVVAAGAQVTGIDAAMATGSVIEGVVTRAEDGAPIVDFPVLVFDESGMIAARVFTNASGEYRASPLRAGSYRVRFDAPLDLATEYWHNAYEWDTAAIVTLGDQQTATQVNAALDPISYISGTVTKAVDGSPVEARIGVTRADGFTRSANAAADGSYRIAVPPGAYLLDFLSLDPEILDEYWEDARDQETATPVVVGPGADVTGIDAKLDSAGIITGVVTMASSEEREVEVEAWAGDERVSWVPVDLETGSYTLYLPSGTYILRATAYFYNLSPTRAKPQYYDGVATADLATPVTAVPAATIDGVDFTLVPFVPPGPEPEPEPEPSPVPAPSPTLSLSAGSVLAGSDIDVAGAGFVPGQPISFELRSGPVALGSLTADASGTLTGSFRVPSGTAAGMYTLAALNPQSTVVASAALQVAAVPGDAATGAVTGTDEPLANSGADLPAFTLMMASGLLLAGVLLMRRRRSHS